LIQVGAAPDTVARALEQVEIGMQRAGRKRHGVARLLVITARVDADKVRVIDYMRPSAAGMYRHRHAAILLQTVGLQVPDTLPTYPRPYSDLSHAVDWEEAKRLTRFVPDEAVEAILAVGSAAEIIDRVRALAALDIDAIWWRDEGSYTRPVELVEALSPQVLPRVRGH